MHKLIISILLATYSVIVFGQSDIHHQAPSNPAFSVLDFEPTSILRPTSPSELSTNILNSFDKDGKLNPNVGLEFAPFWLKSRPTLKREAYLNPTVGQSVIQTLQISGANILDTATNIRKQSIGFRFQLFSGHPTNKYIELSKDMQKQLNTLTLISPARSEIGESISTLQEAINFISDALEDSDENYGKDFIQTFRLKATNVSKNYYNTNSSIKKFIEELVEIYKDGSLISKTAEVSREKVGFIFEIAGASAFSTSKLNNNSDFEKAGFWMTVSDKYTEQDQWMITARYLFTSKDTTTSNLDFGLSYVKDINNFSLSIEAIARWSELEFDDVNQNNNPIRRVEDDFTYRIAANLTYNLSEYINLSASMGKNYGVPLKTEANYFSIIGLNFNLFRKNTEVDFN